MSTFIPIPNKMQTFAVSGVGLYNDPNSIYSEGHKLFSSNPINGLPDITSIVQTIDLLEGDKLFVKAEDPVIHKFYPSLNENIEIPIDKSGISVALRFLTHTIKTTTNTFINI